MGSGQKSHQLEVFGHSPSPTTGRQLTVQTQREQIESQAEKITVARISISHMCVCTYIQSLGMHGPGVDRAEGTNNKLTLVKELS